jgi:hypothetical protein
MSNLHKLFKELQKLDYDDFDLLCDAWREHQNVKINCKNMGIKYSDKYLIKSFTNRVNNQGLCVAVAGTPPNQGNRTKKIEQIILGDNLDIIEEAAKKKGLL